MFFTLQGEGINAGRPAVFLRFSGCNLWTGREADRSKGLGACSIWCDTNFVGTNGPGGGRFETSRNLAVGARALWPKGFQQPFVVCTGGEPLLQLDEPLIDELHGCGFEVAVETNGTRAAPVGLDWVCMSPKAGTDCILREGDELKLVYPQPGAEPERFVDFAFEHFLLQPLDNRDRELHTRLAVDYCLTHPRWRLSLQTQKFLGLP
jgi:7-carboxy-7-deazaguanine synthase